MLHVAVFTKMYYTIIIVVSIYSVFHLKNADAASCYKFSQTWDNEHVFSQNDNSWCKNSCKEANAKYQYSGTSYNYCYCRETEPSAFDKVDEDDECTWGCPGNNEDICGGYVNDHLLTVSKIDRTTGTVTEENTQAISSTSVSTRVSAITELINMISSDTSSAIATKNTHYTTRELLSTTSQNANNNVSSVMIETSTPTTTDRTTVTGTEKNTHATSATYVSTRESAMTDFMNIITSKTSSEKASKRTPYTIRELSSTTTQNANNELSSVMTETSAQTTTVLSTETLTVSVTNKEANGTTSVSIRESTTTEFIRMITNDTSPLIVTQSTPNIMQEQLSTTYENYVTATSTVMTETSTQKTTANGEWSPWNNWTFCEVNCVREDTTNGTQIRRRTCNGTQCSDGKNITDAEVKKMVHDDFNKNIKSEISIDKKTVSKEIRKKNSSVDKRKSSQSIGWGCIVFLVLLMVFLIAIDILNCCIHFRSRFGDRKQNRIRPISISQDQRDSTTPLQENVNVAESYYASRCGNDLHPDEMKRETYQRRRDDNNQLGRDEWKQYM